MKNKKKYPSFSQLRYYLILELLSIYVILPTILYFLVSPPVLPILWLVAILCFWIILHDKTFDREDLWRTSVFKDYSKTIFIQFIIISAILFTFVYILMPELLFSLIKEKPSFWILIIFLYPLISVYPQEVVYRTFFFHRYQILFSKKWERISINALLFGYMHIVFHNWIAILLTIGGGLLFAWMYERTHSTLFVSIAHAFYGNMLFTLGLGAYFYNGTIAILF